MKTLTSTNLDIIHAKEDKPLKLLHLSVKLWFVIATLGQWMFAAYIMAFYYGSTLNGNFEKWNKVLPKGYIPGDWVGNLMVGIHVLLAAIMVIGGPLQIMPQVRNRFKTFHRWVGRVYVTTAVLVSLAGLVMLWTRSVIGSVDMRIFNTIQAVYIFSFAFLAIKYARSKQFALHRTWTLRLFMVVNGVWFFRVGLMAWLLLNGGPKWIDTDTFTGPFLSALSFFTYALPIPLVLLELYFYVQKNQRNWLTITTSVLILFFTALMTIGIFGAVMGLWLPRM